MDNDNEIDMITFWSMDGYDNGMDGHYNVLGTWMMGYYNVFGSISGMDYNVFGA